MFKFENTLDSAECDHFTLLFCREDKEMYTKNYDARAQPFFCLLNFVW